MFAESIENKSFEKATLNINEEENELSAQLLYPQSEYFRKRNVSLLEYSTLSRAADSMGRYEAKCFIELDRGLRALERGCECYFLKLNPIIASPKHHVLYVQSPV